MFIRCIVFCCALVLAGVFDGKAAPLASEASVHRSKTLQKLLKRADEEAYRAGFERSKQKFLSLIQQERDLSIDQKDLQRCVQEIWEVELPREGSTPGTSPTIDASNPVPKGKALQWLEALFQEAYKAGFEDGRTHILEIVKQHPGVVPVIRNVKIQPEPLIQQEAAHLFHELFSLYQKGNEASVLLQHAKEKLPEATSLNRSLLKAYVMMRTQALGAGSYQRKHTDLSNSVPRATIAESVENAPQKEGQQASGLKESSKRLEASVQVDPDMMPPIRKVAIIASKEVKTPELTPVNQALPENSWIESSPNISLSEMSAHLLPQYKPQLQDDPPFPFDFPEDFFDDGRTTAESNDDSEEEEEEEDSWFLAPESLALDLMDALQEVSEEAYKEGFEGFKTSAHRSIRGFDTQPDIEPIRVVAKIMQSLRQIKTPVETFQNFGQLTGARYDTGPAGARDLSKKASRLPTDKDSPLEKALVNACVAFKPEAQANDVQAKDFLERLDAVLQTVHGQGAAACKAKLYRMCNQKIKNLNKKRGDPTQEPRAVCDSLVTKSTAWEEIVQTRGAGPLLDAFIDWKSQEPGEELFTQARWWADQATKKDWYGIQSASDHLDFIKEDDLKSLQGRYKESPARCHGRDKALLQAWLTAHPKTAQEGEDFSSD